MANLFSVVIITKNEEHNIERCLKSVQWADEILVVDSGSIDQTVHICRKFNCRIIESEWLGYGRTKKLAVDSASHDWIFSIDADEEVTDELRAAIQKILEKPEFHGFAVRRRSFYLGKMIRYCGWHRDYPLRLFNRQSGNFNEKAVHESVRVTGKVGRIEALLLHYTYPSIQSHIVKMNRYAELGARNLWEKGKSSTIASAILRSFAKFLKMYIVQMGFLDGKIGFLLSYHSAFGVYLKYVKLWEMRR